MNGIDLLTVTAVVLLAALAVAAGLQVAQDRAASHVAAVGRHVREYRLARQSTAPEEYCAVCGRVLHPPT
jgi:hypothetical protein